LTKVQLITDIISEVPYSLGRLDSSAALATKSILGQMLGQFITCSDAACTVLGDIERRPSLNSQSYKRNNSRVYFSGFALQIGHFMTDFSSRYISCAYLVLKHAIS
jgi:hypothetical protein